MFNAFLKYERDFRDWVDADFPGINPLSQHFLEHLREQKEGKRTLWAHQMESVQRVVYSFELLGTWSFRGTSLIERLSCRRQPSIASRGT